MVNSKQDAYKTTKGEKMGIRTEKTKTYYCDICKNTVPKTSMKKCLICKKHICYRCRAVLKQTYRKIPDSGYWLRIKDIGSLCKDCLYKKLGVELE